MKKTIIALLLTLPFLACADDLLVLTKDNTISMNTIFMPDTVAQITKQAKDLDSRTTSTDPIYLVMNSPGGAIDPGLELIENLSNLRRPVVTLTLFSASMGFQTVQGLGERLITSNGTLMSHKAKGSFEGEFPGQLDQRYHFYLKRVFRMDQKAADRSKGKYTLDTYHNLIENEFWCDGQDCVDHGFADRVVRPSCDKSLSGTTMVLADQFMFMGVAVQVKAEYDNCPLNTNALKYEVAVNGKNVFNDISPEAPKPDSWSLFTVPQAEGTKVNAEMMFEIQKRVDLVVSRRVNKEVIKGY